VLAVNLPSLFFSCGLVSDAWCLGSACPAYCLLQVIVRPVNVDGPDQPQACMLFVQGDAYHTILDIKAV
jgi:hypothetical protein